MSNDAADEIEHLRHDIERHIAITTEQQTEIERLHAERDELLAAVKMCAEFFDPTVDSRMYAKLQAAIAAVEEKP